RGLPRRWCVRPSLSASREDPAEAEADEEERKCDRDCHQDAPIGDRGRPRGPQLAGERLGREPVIDRCGRKFVGLCIGIDLRGHAAGLSCGRGFWLREPVVGIVGSLTALAWINLARRSDLTGGQKVAWAVFLIVPTVPFVYVLTGGDLW